MPVRHLSGDIEWALDRVQVESGGLQQIAD